VAIDNDGDTQEITKTVQPGDLSVTFEAEEFGDLEEPKIYEVYVNGDLVATNDNVEENDEGSVHLWRRGQRRRRRREPGSQRRFLPISIVQATSMPGFVGASILGLR